LATVSAAQKPHLVPFTFAITGDLIVHAVDHKPKSSRDLKRLRNIAENGRVCALVDDYSDDWSRLWWVRADGIAEVWPDAGQDVLALLAEKYRQYREQVPAGPFVAIRVDRWAGWSA
jgi:PPOX class probable F420-dependent enzyme